MNIDQNQVDELLLHPSESLNVEIKRWLDPDSPEGIAKLVKGAQAIRNRNGGFFVLGFDDKTLRPDNTNMPSDPRTAFHVDKIQGVTSRYSSEPFEVGVAFGRRAGAEYPVIAIPEGVTAPIAAKRDLQDTSGASLIREGDVYFRTLSANGTPSTARARPSDWREIVNICFENREADIGRFLRRHLAGPNIEKILSAFMGGIRGDLVAPPSLRERAEALRNDGKQHFIKAIESRSLSTGELELLNVATWQVSLVVDPPKADAMPDREFFRRFSSANPQYTGWPVWLDSSMFDDKLSRPHVVDKAWQALIVSKGWSTHLDFMRLNPTGEFYLWRVLQDDVVPSRVTPKTSLDPILVIIRVAEVIAVGLRVVRVLGWDETARLGFAFEWTKLSGRFLNSWANPLVTVLPGSVAQDDEVATFVEVPAGTPLSAIAPYVGEATRELFLAFDGHSLSTEAVELWTKRLLERKLGDF